MRYFLPYYQPIINSDSELICGVEVLSRQIHRNDITNPFDLSRKLHKNLKQDIFLKILRQSVSEICDFAYFFQTDFNTPFFVSYNFDASVLAVATDEILALSSRLKTHQIQMVIELMEYDNYPEMNLNGIIESLKSKCKFALDDFGAQHSNIMQLFCINPDYVKLDKSIFQFVDSDIITWQLKTFNNFCQNLKSLLIVEGVERPEHVKILDDANIQMRQGFFYYYPMPFEELLLNLERQR